MPRIETPVSADGGAAEVARFYDSTTDKFLAVYGEVIQAFRTRNVEDYLDYTIASAQLESRNVCRAYF
jgi:hypothetical protein